MWSDRLPFNKAKFPQWLSVGKDWGTGSKSLVWFILPSSFLQNCTRHCREPQVRGKEASIKLDKIIKQLESQPLSSPAAFLQYSLSFLSIKQNYLTAPKPFQCTMHATLWELWVITAYKLSNTSVPRWFQMSGPNVKDIASLLYSLRLCIAGALKGLIRKLCGLIYAWAPQSP